MKKIQRRRHGKAQRHKKQTQRQRIRCQRTSSLYMVSWQGYRRYAEVKVYKKSFCRERA